MSAWFKIPKHFLLAQNICLDKMIRALIYIHGNEYGIYYHGMLFHQEGVQISEKEH